MNHALATTSPAASLRQFVTRAWRDPDVRSASVGVLGVVLILLFMWLLGPQLTRLQRAPVITPHSTQREFSVEITPEMFEQLTPKPPPTPKRFVETNPDAPENIPDKTNNFAAQNQQVAQEKPTPDGESERPAMEGKKDFETNQIVTGTLQRQQEPVPTSVATPDTPTPPSQSAPRAEQNPLTGTEKVMGDNETGLGTNISRETTNVRPIQDRIEGAKDVPLLEGTSGIQPAIDAKHPRSRPSLVKQQQVRPAILAENKVGTKNMGVTAINAKFNEYGLYLHRMAEAVQLEFDRVVGDTQAFPPEGSYVTIRFVLDSHGNIPRIINVENHSSDIGARMALSALTNRVPYGEWTQDMKNTLNPDGEELLFTFYYMGPGM